VGTSHDPRIAALNLLRVGPYFHFTSLTGGVLQSEVVRSKIFIIHGLTASNDRVKSLSVVNFEFF
jgi:hypothetical protein